MVEDPACDRHDPQVGVNAGGRHDLPLEDPAVVRADRIGEALGERFDFLMTGAREGGEVVEVACGEGHAFLLGVGQGSVEVEDEDSRFRHGAILLCWSRHDFRGVA